MNYFGQLIGIFAVGMSFFIYLQKSRKRIVFLKLITDVLWVLHFLAISTHTAAATTGMAIFREIAFLPEQKGNKSRGFIKAGFSVLFLLAAIFTWKDYFSIFPAIASILSTFAFGSDRVKMIRIFAYLSSVCMFAYGIHCFSIPTIMNEVIAETSIIISFVKSYRDKNMQKD